MIPGISLSGDIYQSHLYISVEWAKTRLKYSHENYRWFHVYRQHLQLVLSGHLFSEGCLVWFCKTKWCLVKIQNHVIVNVMLEYGISNFSFPREREFFVKFISLFAVVPCRFTQYSDFKIPWALFCRKCHTSTVFANFSGHRELNTYNYFNFGWYFIAYHWRTSLTR